MATGWSRAPKGEPVPDWTQEPVTVGVIDIKVVLLSSGKYQARMTYSAPERIGTVSSAPSNTANGAVKDLAEWVIANPILDGQV